MHNCFHKYYRYLAYSNTLYSYMTADGDLREVWDEVEREQTSPEEAIGEAAMEALARKSEQARSIEEVNKISAYG